MGGLEGDPDFFKVGEKNFLRLGENSSPIEILPSATSLGQITINRSLLNQASNAIDFAASTMETAATSPSKFHEALKRYDIAVQIVETALKKPLAEMKTIKVYYHLGVLTAGVPSQEIKKDDGGKYIELRHLFTEAEDLIMQLNSQETPDAEMIKHVAENLNIIQPALMYADGIVLDTPKQPKKPV